MNKNLAFIISGVCTLLAYGWCMANPEEIWHLDLGIYWMILYILLCNKYSK